jgi:Raf kinase inhibitor-like YbhB/YbcL family protein
MTEHQRPPLPYEFLPPVPALTVTSTDVHDGAMLGNDQVMNGMGLSGRSLSPQLSWSGAPEGTKAYAVTCFDPDAPTGSGFWHWVLFNVPASVTELATGAGSGDQHDLPAGAVHARNDVGMAEFVGAAPPEGHGPHRYVFTVHAVDTEDLGVDAQASPALVGFMLWMHTLARGSVVPVYER